MTQQEGEPWAHSEPVAIELTEFDARTDFLGFALDPIHTSTAVVVTVELDGLTEIAWDGLVFLPRYSAGSSWAGNDLILRRLGGWPAGRIAVRVEIVDHFDESLVPKTTHAGVLSAATLTAAGTITGGVRPLVDANHIHVWNCDETAGALVLADSVGSADLTLQGGEGTAYTLNQTVSGSPYPSVRSLLANASAGIAANASMGISAVSAISWECVFTPDNFTNGYQVFAWLAKTDNTQVAYSTLFGSPCNRSYSGIKGASAIDLYTNPSGGPVLVAGDTHHFLTTYKDTGGGWRLRLYIDGVLIEEVGGSTGTLTLDAFTLAGQPGYASSASGYLRDVRVSNIERDATYAAAAFAALV